ncbi:putative syntaxin domain-containing protein [Helianthus annuus]|nr:putative syntaxin domain-containing protein [Helianthus annuus]
MFNHLYKSYCSLHYIQASKKITDAKLAKDFQAVLKEFQKAQRLSAERETAYSPSVPQAIHSSR